jgi:hypothetical protein
MKTRLRVSGIGILACLFVVAGSAVAQGGELVGEELEFPAGART